MSKKSTQTVGILKNKKGKGRATKKASSNKTSRNYKKSYRGQGR
jgi:hypothetical protein